MAIEETTQRLISNDSLTPAQVSLNDKVLLPRTTSDPLTTVGTIKSDLVVECTGAPDSEGRYNATVLNNGSDFAVYNGLEVTCKFTNACSVTNPKFMINNLGAAGMRLANQASTVDIGVNCWSAGAILCLKYVSFSDGTAYWLLKDISTASISNGVITRADGTTEYNKQSVDNNLNSAISYYLVGQATGTEGVSLPSNYHEINVNVYIQSKKRLFKFHFIKDELQRDGVLCTIGWGYSSYSNFCELKYTTSGNKISITNVTFDNINYNTSALITVYAR